MTTATSDMFGGDRDALDFGSGAGPGRPGQVIRLHPQTGQRHLDWLLWGLLPPGAQSLDGAPRPIHARAETVAELPMFAEAFRLRRAIVPATEYYQRRTIGEPGQRHAISRKDGQPMAMAGLWEALRWPDGEIVRTYCLITVRASGAVAEIHDRMPLVLNEPDWPLWLGEVPGDPATLLHPPADDVLVLRPRRERRSAASSAQRRRDAHV
ncbi:MAG TPA: SOS response-associated peptidase [Rhodopila sp.]